MMLATPAVIFLLFLVAFVTMIAMQKAYTIDRLSIKKQTDRTLERAVLEAEKQNDKAGMYRERWLTGQMRLREFGGP